MADTTKELELAIETAALARDSAQEAAQEARWYRDLQDYYKTEHWRKYVRPAILGRAGYICECCHERVAVLVHHLRYARGCRPGSPDWIAQEKVQDLEARCQYCHSKAHPHHKPHLISN